MKLSVVIITLNEESNLKRCLDSISFADEIIVVDSHSTDRTVEIAEQAGALVTSIEWTGYGNAKQAGVELAKGEWIFSIDADEVVSDSLAEEIQALLKNRPSHAAYSVPRLTNFLGRWIHHSGWYPDRVIRLFKADKAAFDGAIIHEKVVVEGSVGKLKADLLHFSYPDLETYFDKFNRYTTIGAEKAFQNGKRGSALDLLARPPAAFAKCYLTGQGFRDGIEGLIISILSSVSVFVKYSKLRHLHRTNSEKRTLDKQS